MASPDIARPRADTWLRDEARGDVVADDVEPADGPIHPCCQWTAFPTTAQERSLEQEPPERLLVDTELDLVRLVMLGQPRYSLRKRFPRNSSFVAAAVPEPASRSLLD